MSVEMTPVAKAKNTSKINLRKKQMKHWRLLVLVLPALIYIIIFQYLPMYGIIIAFEDFKPHSGYLGSKFVGLKHFIRFFNNPNFWSLMRNTILLSLYQLIVTFPLPIILAISINSLKNSKYKRIAQLVTYAPHFISVIVLVSIMKVMLDPQFGVINHILSSLGMKTQFFMGDPDLFRSVYVWSDVWQTTGWSSIIYFAALAGVDPTIHESARIDGATQFQRIRYIDLPSIMPVMVTILILNAGKIMNIGFEKVFAMQNSLNIGTSEIISTYVYQMGIKEGQYSYSAAINLFNSLINLALLLIVNRIAKKVTDQGIL